MLLGNKTDLEDQRKVPSEQGAAIALENDYIFMETSCLKNTNVSNAFETLIELTNIEAKKNNIALRRKGTLIAKEKHKNNSGCFC